jgi:hypothetical protein
MAQAGIGQRSKSAASEKISLCHAVDREIVT